jgi:hypothetical protein
MTKIDGEEIEDQSINGKSYYEVKDLSEAPGQLYEEGDEKPFNFPTKIKDSDIIQTFYNCQVM